MLVLHVLGQCLIRTAVTTITPRADMCFALASYLTRERGNRVPRRTLENLFWPGMPAAPASHSLSELVHKLRRKGVPIERDGAACIWLPREAATVDVETLGSAPLTSIAERDLAILPGYAPRASAAFHDWLDDWRGHLQLRVLDEVTAAIPRAIAGREWHTTLALADQALRIDSHSEQALLARAQAADELSRLRRGAVSPPDRRATVLHETAAPSPWPARQRALADSDTALVGRERLMALLDDECTHAIRAGVRAIFLSGPAGVGKSRLVREFTSSVNASRAAVCTVACGRHDNQRPLSVFVHAVPRLQAIPGAAGCAPATIACLARITQLALDTGEMSERDDSLNVSASVRAAVVDLVDAVADEQPLVLVVEDVHWIDTASWSLLRTIAATAQHSVLLVCTSRTRWQHSIWGEPSPFLLEEVPLLEPTAAREHLTNRLERARRSADERFVDWCVDTSGGNPYFIEELVNFWLATGEQYTAPPSLVALTEARLACLRPDALRVIQAAAILGRNSTLELLQQVLEFPTHLLFSAIEELADAGLLTSTIGHDEGRTAPVICRHDLIIRAATRTLSTQGRALLHHASARALEPIALHDRSTDLLWDCADHWQAAGQTARSIHAAITCARHLHDMGLVHDAIERCQTILATCCNDDHRSVVLRVLAEAQYAARDWASFCDTVASVRRLEGVRQTTEPVHDDLELCELSAQRSLHRDWSRALEATLHCVHSLDAAPHHRLKAAVTALKLATNLGDMTAMDATYLALLPLASSSDISTTDWLTASMIYHTIRGEPGTAASAARQLLSIAERTLPARHRLCVQVDCAGALRRTGSDGEAEAIYETVFQSAVELGSFDFAADACHRSIEMHCDSGDMLSAAEWADRYRRLRRPKPELCKQRHLRLALARVLLWQARWEDAARLVEPRNSEALWDDPVMMLRSAALAIKLRLQIGRSDTPRNIANWVVKLAPLNACLRMSGAQDYETYSLYLGYRYIRDDAAADELLRTYLSRERRDTAPIGTEISDELKRCALGLRS